MKMWNRWRTRERQRRPGERTARGTVILCIAISQFVAGPAQADAVPEDAKALTSSQTFVLFVNKTWVWQDGGGWFDRSGEFKAWSGEGPTASYAHGKWWVNDQGGVCFQATWHSAKGSQHNRTCFSHRRSGKTVYQKKEPSGSWYAFRNSPAKAEDEFNKLKSGNLIEGKWKITKEAITPETNPRSAIVQSAAPSLRRQPTGADND
jgi:hypothetical protein